MCVAGAGVVIATHSTVVRAGHTDKHGAIRTIDVDTVTISCISSHAHCTFVISSATSVVAGGKEVAVYIEIAVDTCRPRATLVVARATLAVIIVIIITRVLSHAV